MRIGLIIYGLDRPLTGISRYILEITQALAALKEPIELFLLSAGSPGPLSNLEGFHYIRLPGCQLLPGLMTLGSVELPRLARRYCLDVLHDPTGVTPFAFGSGSARQVVTLHDVFPWSCPGKSAPLDNLIYRAWLPRVLPNGRQRIITVSQQSRRDIETFLHVSGERVNVIPEGIGGQFRPLPPGEVQECLWSRFGITWPYILFVGALNQRKNNARAHQAFARIAPEFPELHFVIAGPRSWKKTPLENILESLQIGNRVLLTGPVSDADLPALYNGARLFVFPSLYEGFGLPPLEAMACGVPVITSNVSSLPVVAGEAALLVDPYDVDNIAQTMHLVLSNPHQGAEMKAIGQRQAARFTWERTARATLDVYQNLPGAR